MIECSPLPTKPLADCPASGGEEARLRVWFLVGRFLDDEPVRNIPLQSFPVVIGRRQDATLSIASHKISSLHAQLIEEGDTLLLRDLGSTNGTFVNGNRVEGTMTVRENDLIQFADVALRLLREDANCGSQTISEDLCEQALALVQFDKVLNSHEAVPYFQPIVKLDAKRETVAFEVLGRSQIRGLESAGEMFRAAARLNLEAELSQMFRWKGVEESLRFPTPPHLFLNTHPAEIGIRLGESLARLREVHRTQPLTLEIHEHAITNLQTMKAIRDVLRDLNISLAYDDFGVGQNRLKDLVDVPPDVVKFDMSMIRGIDTAAPERLRAVSGLVKMVRDLGVIALAEGVETAEEAAACVEIGFQMAQGYYFGRPAPVTG